jgi:hypothetical protein
MQWDVQGCLSRFVPMQQAQSAWPAKKSPTIGSRFIPGFCSALVAYGRTLKASYNIAQGKRSGVAAKRHPGFGFNDRVSTL